MRTRINALFFDPKKFTREKARAWAKRIGYIDHDLIDSGLARSGGRIVIKLAEMSDEHEYREMVLGDGVKARIEIVGGGAMRGAYRDAPQPKFYVGPQGNGGSPTHNVAPLPDFNDIYNSRADDPETKDRESEIASTRRSQSARLNGAKFGIHGVSAPEPVLAYEPEHYPLVSRGRSGQERDSENPNEKPQPRAMRFVVTDKHRKLPQRETPNGAVQPAKPGDDE